MGTAREGSQVELSDKTENINARLDGRCDHRAADGACLLSGDVGRKKASRARAEDRWPEEESRRQGIQSCSRQNTRTQQKVRPVAKYAASSGGNHALNMKN